MLDLLFIRRLCFIGVVDNRVAGLLTSHTVYFSAYNCLPELLQRPLRFFARGVTCT